MGYLVASALKLLVFSTIGFPSNMFTFGMKINSDSASNYLRMDTESNDWKDIAKTTLCESSGSDSEIASAITNRMLEYDTDQNDSHNWVVVVTPATSDYYWTTYVKWNVLAEKDICAKNLMVFQRSTWNIPACEEDLREQIGRLVGHVSGQTEDCHTMADLIGEFEDNYNLAHHIIVTAQEGAWAASDSNNCHEFVGDGSVDVFFYGCPENYPDTFYGC